MNQSEIHANRIEFDTATGREIRFLTDLPGDCYALYYFVPSHTADGNFLVFHHVLNNEVMLKRLDLSSGESRLLSQGHAREAGWYCWCRTGLHGVYNHLSALEPGTGTLAWFDDLLPDKAPSNSCPNGSILNFTNVSNSEVMGQVELPGRLPMGQSAFSPDGRWYAWIDADWSTFSRHVFPKELPHDWSNHQAWRHEHPASIVVFDMHKQCIVHTIEPGYHVHHVIFADNEHLLINHLEHINGMWVCELDGSNAHPLAYEPDQPSVCHQVVTEAGILYEKFKRNEDGSHVNRVGLCDWPGGAYRDVVVPLTGYMHTARVPTGQFLFVEEVNAGNDSALPEHGLYLVRSSGQGEVALQLITSMLPYPQQGQIWHAHPFMAEPGTRHDSNRWLHHTRVVNGHAQIAVVDVADITNNPANEAGLLFAS